MVIDGLGVKCGCIVIVIAPPRATSITRSEEDCVSWFTVASRFYRGVIHPVLTEQRDRFAAARNWRNGVYCGLLLLFVSYSGVRVLWYAGWRPNGFSGRS